jgi:hypothetical protein
MPSFRFYSLWQNITLALRRGRPAHLLTFAHRRQHYRDPDFWEGAIIAKPIGMGGVDVVSLMDPVFQREPAASFRRRAT